MGRIRLPFPPTPVQIWAVEDTTVQITWGDLPAGPVTASTTDTSTTHEHQGGPGGIVVDRLRADAPHRVDVKWRGGSTTLEARTLPTPPGPELARIATISDLHLGSDHFGALKLMRESRSPDEDGFAFRSARAAIVAAREWGATHLVIKGDAAHHGSDDHFALVGQLVDGFPDLEMSLLPGNHDVDHRGGAPLPKSVGRRELAFERHVSTVTLPGLRLILGDTTVERQGTGTLHRIGEDLLGAAAESPAPVMIAIHQQLQEHDTIRYWPPGIRGTEARAFLDELGRAAPAAFVTSGHTHRNRTRRHGPVLFSEVASTHHWPGVWAGYAIHEGGIREVVRRITAPEVVGWHEYSKNAVGSLWGYYAQGKLSDRGIVHHWR